MVKTTVGGNLRMRKQITKTTVPLDVVPERRTKIFLDIFSMWYAQVWTIVEHI